MKQINEIIPHSAGSAKYGISQRLHNTTNIVLKYFVLSTSQKT